MPIIFRVIYVEFENMRMQLLITKALLISDDKTIPEDVSINGSSYNNIGFFYLNSEKYLASKLAVLSKGLQQNLFKITIFQCSWNLCIQNLN
jgi:hypothetical protein